MFWEGSPAAPLVLPTAAPWLQLLVVGCGAGAGVGRSRPSASMRARRCARGAKEELARHGGEAGSVRVRVVCTGRCEAGAGWTSRPRAPMRGGRPRTRPRSASSSRPAREVGFTRPILDEAQIALIAGQLRGRGDGDDPHRARLARSDEPRRILAKSVPANLSSRGSGAPLEQIRERVVDVGEPELVAEVQRPARHDPLPAA